MVLNGRLGDIQNRVTLVLVISPETGNAGINALIQENADVFSAKGERNGACKASPLRIKTTGPPICQKAYRMPLNKRQIVEDMIDDMLCEGVIRPSNSPYSSPILLVDKKDNGSRLCVDYRKLNQVTEYDAFQLPHIKDIFDLVGGSKIYSTLDLKAGFYQMPVAEEDIPKTAFRCHVGSYEYIKVPFGLKNAPTYFQREMNRILADLIGKCVFVYIDDILVFSKTEEEHVDHLQLVFDRLREAGLKLKPTKCAFGLPEVKLLGYILNEQGIQTDPDKVAAIANLQPPTTVKEVRSMLGMCNYYRSSLPNYAKVAEPLIELTRKYVRFTWNKERQEAFDELKRLLTSSHVMAPPDINKPYKMYTDACDFAIGGILVQDSDDGVEKVIQYISHTLSATQRKWPTIEKEAYAVVHCIDKLRPYLYGAQFKCYVDHKPLLSLFTQSMNNTRIQRWGVLLAEFGATIHYRQGKRLVRADMLSRIRQSTDSIAAVDIDEPLDPDALPPDDEIGDILPLIHDGLELKTVAVDQRKEFPDLWQRGKLDDDEEYTIIHGVLYSVKPPNMTAPMYPRLVLPKAYREAVIERAHKECGHMAVWKTVRRVTEAYVWVGLRRDVRAQLRKCTVCLMHNQHPARHAMGEMPIASFPFQICSMDLIGPLNISPRGNKYILTIIDFCTGYAECFPIPSKTNENVWNAFTNGFISRHGCPEILLTDLGTEFTALEFEKYLEQIGVEHRTTTPFHPSCNGRIERFNKTVKYLIQRAVDNQPNRWEDVLNDALLAYRTSVSSTTGYTPHFLVTGRKLRMPMEKTLRISNEQSFGNRLDDLAIALKIARVNTEESRKYNRERLARKENARQISPGDTVIIKAEGRLTFTSRWDPEWIVTRVRGPVIFLHHQRTGKTKVLNQEKVRIVDPELRWDKCHSRPKRKQERPSRYRRRLAQIRNDRQPPHVDPADTDSEDSVSEQHGPEIINSRSGSPEQTQRPLEDSNHHGNGRYDLTAQTADVAHDDKTVRRTRRIRALSTRARLAADASEDSDLEVDPIITHFRKRRTLAPTEFIQKRSRRECICLVALFTH